jgi:hypothetical protein
MWFGQYQIADFIGEPAAADRYEAAMRRRFPGLEITNDPLPLPRPPEPAVRASRPDLG